MVLYALHFEKLISADEAEDRGNYRCLECKGALQIRHGRRRRHFYHVKTTPSCRLYSKSEDHLLLQLQIQSLFIEGEIALERPFLSIGRMADACWERHKLVFEIQCSMITRAETEERTRDYGSLGYQIIWLLDDRLFNRRRLRPAEEFLRKNICYYIHYKKMDRSLFYDQFELVRAGGRLRKSPPSLIKLTCPRKMPFLEGPFPLQIEERSQRWPLFFEGDMFHKALLSKTVRPLAICMQNWVFIEKNAPPEEAKKKGPPPWLFTPLYRFFEWFLQKMNA